LRGAVCTSLSLGIGNLCLGQDVPNSSLFSGRITTTARLARQPGQSEALPPPAATPAPTSWYEVPLPPPKEVKVHDIVTIRVDTGARVSTSAQLQNRRTAQYDARLNDWVILEGLRAVKPAPQSDGDQRIQGNLNQLDRATGQLDTTESLKFDIAATVAAVLPNGNIVLEAHRSIRTNDEQWMHSLSGVCRREDIGPGNVVLSRDIANLQVEKRELGQIRDSYKRGWLSRWFDQFDPF
jgi:flagellar L-ring protein precursor FlgH